MASANAVLNPLSVDGKDIPAWGASMSAASSGASSSSGAASGCSALAGMSSAAKITLGALALMAVVGGSIGIGISVGMRVTASSTSTGSTSAPDLATAALAAALPNSVTWIAIGDWGRYGNEAQMAPVPAMSAWATRLKASGELAFILSVGDNFYDGPDNDTDTEHWTKSFLQVYTAPALVQTPWYIIYGNHDYRGNLSVQLGWGTRPGGDPRWITPGLNWTMEMPLGRPLTPGSSCAAFVLLDTCPYITAYAQRPEDTEMANQLATMDPQGQWAWFNQSLANAVARCPAVAVIGHHPIWGGARHAQNPLQQDLRTRLHLNDLFTASGVDMYLNGHDHLLMHSEEAADGTAYILTGAGSNVRVGEMAGLAAENRTTPTTKWWAEVQGFTVHSMNATHTLTSFVDAAGAVLHSVFRAVRAKRPQMPITVAARA